MPGPTATGAPPGGPVGFFDHSQWRFGLPLQWSALAAAVQAIPGVAGVLSIDYRLRGVQADYTAMPDTVTVAPRVNGYVDQVFVIDNQTVKAGDPLFQVDDRHLQAQLTLAKARARSARAQLTKLEQLPRPEDVPPSEAKVQAARANADRTRDEFERTRALLSRGAVSDEEAVGKRLRHERECAAGGGDRGARKLGRSQHGRAWLLQPARRAVRRDGRVQWVHLHGMQPMGIPLQR